MLSCSNYCVIAFYPQNYDISGGVQVKILKVYSCLYNRFLYCFEYICVINPDDLGAIALTELAAATHWQQQYRLIIQWGKLIKPKPDIRLSINLIKGCELPVWLVHEQEGERHYFAFDSDSTVMNGLAALLLVQLNGKTSVQIAGASLMHSLQHLRLEKHLTPSRNNGFIRIIERALAFVGD